MTRAGYVDDEDVFPDIGCYMCAGHDVIYAPEETGYLYLCMSPNCGHTWDDDDERHIAWNTYND